MTQTKEDAKQRTAKLKVLRDQHQTRLSERGQYSKTNKLSDGKSASSYAADQKSYRRSLPKQVFHLTTCCGTSPP